MINHPSGYKTRALKPFNSIFLIAIIAVAISLNFASPANASYPSQDINNGERIISFDSDIFVRNNGTIDVTETIVYDFGFFERRGIFRYIPVSYPYDGEKPEGAVRGSKYSRVTPFTLTGVSREGKNNENYEIIKEGRNEVIKIGDEDIFLRGAHTYRISYSLKAFINEFEQHDELYFNVTGNGWNIPIESVRTTVTVEGADQNTQYDTLCFQGQQGSSLPCSGETVIGDGEVVFEQGNLFSTAGKTIVVAVEKGVIEPQAPILREDWSIASNFRITKYTVAGFVGVFALGLALVLLLVYKHGRDKRFVGSAIDRAMGNLGGEEQAVPIFESKDSVVEFVPPDNIRPGQIGVLIDEHVDDLDVTATIIDLAVRGYFHIGEKKEEYSTIFGTQKTKTQYWLSKTKEYEEDKELRTYERQLLRALFSEKDSFYLIDLTPSQGSKIYKTRDSLYNEVKTQKWFSSRPDKTRSKWKLIGNIAIVLSLVLIAGLQFLKLGFVALGFIVPAVLLRLLYKKMPSRTAKGTAMVSRVMGFKKIFDAGEGDRQKFAEHANLFVEYLPYAIVFGCTQKWAKIFEDLGFSEEDLGVKNFYSAEGAFSALAFNYAIGSFSNSSMGTFSALHAQASKSYSSGSSGFSGGGFSGGGGGGGGGGSW